MEHSTKNTKCLGHHIKKYFKKMKNKNNEIINNKKKEKISSKLFSPLIYIFQIEISSTFYSRHKI